LDRRIDGYQISPNDFGRCRYRVGMATIDRFTGTLISGLDDLWQSIGTILTTTLASLVMARDFGSDLPRMTDRSVSPLTLIEFYAAVPGAINRINPESLMAEEPRFRIVRMSLSTDSKITAGNPVFDIEGIYYPRGHLGDYSEAVDTRGRVVISDEMVREVILS
jgi:phage baseplate assembly protein W